MHTTRQGQALLRWILDSHPPAPLGWPCNPRSSQDCTAPLPATTPGTMHPAPRRLCAPACDSPAPADLQLWQAGVLHVAAGASHLQALHRSLSCFRHAADEKMSGQAG